MAQLRLGRAPDPFGDDREDDELGLFRSSDEAYNEDVLPRVTPDRAAPQPSAPLQVADAKSARGQQATMFDFDLYGGSSAPSASREPAASAPPKGGTFEFDLYGGGSQKSSSLATTEEPQTKGREKGDASRGFSAALDQTPALLKGAVGYVGAVGENRFGEGGVFSGLKKYGLEGYKKGMGEIQARSKDTDDVTKAWDRAKQGDLGALVDWAQYGVGYLAGNVVETVGIAIVGSTAGAIASGPAAPVGAVGGATAGVVGKEAVKSVTRSLIEGMVAKEAAKLAEKQGLKIANDQIVKQATKNVAKNIGATTALAGSSIIKETGGIYGEAEEQAEKDGRELDGGDLSRIFASGVVAGISETVVDKLGLDVAAGKFKIPGGGRAGRALVGGAAGATIEGGQELFQTAVERVGAGKALAGEDAMNDYINSFALGALGGGTLGSVTGALRSGEQDRNRVKEILAEAEKEITSESGRAELFASMMEDSTMKSILEANGIQSGDDPRFQSVIAKSLATQRLLGELAIPTPEERDATRQERQADVQAAFGETPSTAIGSNTGADQPLIKRESVTPNYETKTFEGEAQTVSLPGTDQQSGTVAMTPEDLVSAQQGFEVLPAFSTGGEPIANRFVSLSQAETFLFGPINKETGERQGGYASSVDDVDFQIRRGQRAKSAGGGAYYFVEGRPKQEQVNSAGFVPEPASQVQAQVDAVKENRKPAAVLGTAEAAQANTEGLGSTTVTDPRTDETAVLLSQEKALLDGAQGRVDEVGLRQGMGEALGLAEPTATTQPGRDDIVVQQRDNKTGEIITEQAVSPENVDAVAPVADTTTTVTTVEGAKQERQQPATATAAPATATAVPATTGKPLQLWKFNRTTGMWSAVRDVSPDTQDTWLKTFREDEPNEIFEVAAKRPTKNPVKKTVEQTLKDKQKSKKESAKDSQDKAELAEGARQWEEFAPEDVKWSDLSAEAQKRWATAVSEGNPNMALADELSEKAVAKKAERKTQADADKQIGTKTVTEKQAIEEWENNDDGKSPHIPYDELSKESKQIWREALADGYASISVHDLIVDSNARSARAERANDRAAKNAPSGPVFRVTKLTKGMRYDDVVKALQEITRNWVNVPNVFVVQSEMDLPKVLQDRINATNSSGKVPGVYYRGDVYLVADNLIDKKDVGVTVLHEVAGHFGLRSILGDRYGEVMDQIYNGNKAVRKLADKMVQEEGLPRQLAVEEVLADMAQVGAKPSREFLAALRQIFAAIRKWARETLGINYMSENDVREIVANARRFVITGEYTPVSANTTLREAVVSAMRETSAPTFYSALERETRNVKLNKDAANAQEWSGIINNKLKQSGVKAEEIDWVGINDWLSLPEQQGRQIPRQEVLSFIAGNRRHVNDVVLSTLNRPDADKLSAAEIREPDIDDMREYIREQQEAASDRGVEDDFYSDTFNDSPDDMDLPQARAWVAEHIGWQNFLYEFRRNMERFQRARIGKFIKPKHGGGKLVLPGGNNYTELVLFDPAVQEYKSDDEIHFGDVAKGRAIGWLRMKERKDKDGNTVLFIEEIQSQRAQDLRKGGDVPPAPFIKKTEAWTALLLKRAIAYAQERGIDRIAWTTGEQQNERYDLRKEVDTIFTGRNDDGTWEISGSKDGRTVVSKSGVKEKDLAGELGEDMANAVIESGDGIRLTGDELAMFQQDLRPYYNTTVPSVSKDLIGKKIYGEGKVVVMDIEGTGKQLGFVIPRQMQEVIAQDGLPLFRRRDYEAQYDDLDAKTRDMALNKGHYSPPTIGERLDALKPNLWLRVVQGTFDRFRRVRDIDLKAYIMLRMSSATDGALEGILHFGQVFFDDGALNLRQNTKGLMEILKPVGGEVDRFLLWIAANRAGNLAAQERERFFTAEEINALKKLNGGTMKDGKSRFAVYAEALRQMNELNKSVLDVARQTGLIDEESFKRFSSDIWYVPFYRQMEEDGTLSAANTSSAAVGQYLSKQLKGSSRPLNDLMQNVMLNWSHILSASMKNAAAVQTLKSATSMGDIVSKLTPIDNRFGKDQDGNKVALKYAVKVMEGGKETYYRIDDEFLLASLDAVASMGGNNLLIDVARPFKTTLTRFISLSPTFKINNLIRDSIQSIGLSDLGGSPMANVMQGWRAYEDERAEALVGGALFTLGNAFDGDRAANVKRLLRQGVEKADILTDKARVEAWFKKAWDKYDEVSDAAENANRLALYQQMRAKGASHLEAAYAARDLQDFGLQGSWTAIRFAAQVLPYFNARLQGMYKLGRDGIAPTLATMLGSADDAQRQKAMKFSVVLSAVVSAGLVLYLSQKDDDDWKKREDWDRDAFFWFKIPGTDIAVRVPKPFEMGAVATIVERFTEQIVDSEVEGKVFGKRLAAVLHDNLAINPIPQVVRPLYDIARNKDGFTDRPIESMGAERLSPDLRKNPNTSTAAKALAGINSLFADAVSTITGEAITANNMKISPIQYDYLLRGYLGWVGTVVQTTSDLAARPFKDGETPESKIDDILVVGNYVKTLPPTQSRYVTSFYENSKEIATATADFRSYIAAGDVEKAREYLDEKRDLIVLNKMYTKVQDEMSTISKRIKAIQEDEEMSGEEKRIEMDRLGQLRIELAKRAEEVRTQRKRDAKGFADGGLVKVAPRGMRYEEKAGAPMSAKGTGYFGPLPSNEVNEDEPTNYALYRTVATELSAHDDQGRGYPLIVPTLSKKELNHLLEGKKPTDEIYRKAEGHAEMRRLSGKSPFIEQGELRRPMPEGDD